jgi:creatinine deaminase
MTLISKTTPVSDEVLNLIAHLPTTSLPSVVEHDFLKKLTDTDFMHIAVRLAQKSYDEGGCPIGAVIVEDLTNQIVGKGHNTLVQDNDPYNHGETSALHDAGRRDFSETTLFTTLTPCGICATLCVLRGFRRVVIGNSPDTANSEEMLRGKGVTVDLLPDTHGIDLYARFRREKPALDVEDWQGLAGVRRKTWERVKAP